MEQMLAFKEGVVEIPQDVNQIIVTSTQENLMVVRWSLFIWYQQFNGLLLTILVIK